MENDIGKSIKFYRESRHWTQSKLAEKLGVSQRNVSYYESGQRIPPADVLKKVSTLFDVPVDVILGLKKTASESRDCYNFLYEEGDVNWNMKKIASEKNISYDELVEKTCIPKNRFDMLWYGNVQPIAEELIRIASVLDVTIDYLLDNSQRERLSSDEELILRFYHKFPSEIMELLESFCSLDNKKDRYIVIGKSFEVERNSSSVAADDDLKTGTDNLGK